MGESSLSEPGRSTGGWVKVEFSVPMIPLRWGNLLEVYIYIYTHIYIYILYIYIYIHTYEDICLYIYIYVYTCVCLLVRNRQMMGFSLSILNLSRGRHHRQRYLRYHSRQPFLVRQPVDHHGLKTEFLVSHSEHWSGNRQKLHCQHTQHKVMFASASNLEMFGSRSCIIFDQYPSYRYRLD